LTIFCYPSERENKKMCCCVGGFGPKRRRGVMKKESRLAARIARLPFKAAQPALPVPNGRKPHFG
jgi:hypothetical protein